LNGPACFAGDAIYKNIRMPEVDVGDTLAIMDSGAYFTSLESTFGFPRPAIVLVDGDEVRLIRSRETFDEMVARDAFGSSHTVPFGAPRSEQATPEP
jgi:diaminopimelate decarboxylase